MVMSRPTAVVAGAVRVRPTSEMNPCARKRYQYSASAASPPATTCTECASA
jgi:hypothetical protein